MPDLLMRFMVKDIDRSIRHIINAKKEKKFVIYTNGMGGQLVREYLAAEFRIIPEYTIDNILYDGIEVLNIEQAKKKEKGSQDTYFLICSWHEDYYDEIRKVIYKAFPKEQIIDVFPQKEVLPTELEIHNVLDYVASYINELVVKKCL